MTFHGRYIKKSAQLFSLLLFLAAAGCSTVLPEGMENHIIAADYLGEPAFFDAVDAQGKVVRDGRTVTLPDHLKRMKKEMEKSGRKKIMIYCFGGMNSFEETIEASVRLTEAIEKDSPDIYPIFVNWDSELFGCYLEDLFFVRQGVVNRWWGVLTSPLYFAQNILETLVRLPENMAYQSQTIFSLYADDFYAAIPEALKKHKTDISWYMGKDCSDHTWTPLIRCGYVIGFPFQVITNGLLNAFGSRGWKEMRRRARLGFVKDPEVDFELSCMVSMFSSKQDGVFSHFAEMLTDYARQHPDTEITLIGHCMGTLIATEFLSRYSNLPVKNIVFMAGASSVHETAQVVKPYLERHPQTHFYNLCLHPRIDWFDMMDYMILPCGSVLAWVNEFLTEPASKEGYTVGIWEPAIALLPGMMGGVEKQVTLKAFGIDDPVTSIGKDQLPYQHTHFSSPEIKFWREEFWKIPPAAQQKQQGPDQALTGK